MFSLGGAEGIKEAIRKRHLAQLKQTNPPKDAKNGVFPWSNLSYFGFLEEWSKKAEFQISAAIKAEATGGDDINWNIVLYNFMESAAMYLRDWPSVFAAAEAARDGHEKEALNLLAKADNEIQQIARMWSPDMHYVTICDLVNESPDSDSTLDGPFCGVFFTNSEHPFIGLAFKGTHIESWSEMLVDLRYAPVECTGGRLWNTHVSGGIFETLFGTFSKIGKQTPYDFIKLTLEIIRQELLMKTDSHINLHITGHSLGASYATVCYAELLREHTSRTTRRHAHNSLVLRDLYTFGSPRLVLLDFLAAFSLALSIPTVPDSPHHRACHSWRIANVHDPVTHVPPVFITDPPFVHVDDGWRVFDDDPPAKLPNENGRRSKIPFPTEGVSMKTHTPFAYFKALYHTATQWSKSSL